MTFSWEEINAVCDALDLTSIYECIATELGYGGNCMVCVCDIFLVNFAQIPEGCAGIGENGRIGN